MVVLAMANVFAMALIDFPSSLSFIIACFLPIDSSLVYILVTSLIIDAVCTGKIQPETETKSKHSVLLLFE